MDKYIAAGLTITEGKCYEALLAVTDLKPSELAPIVNESRTNCYKILDKLCQFELVERFDKGAISHFRARNPARLLELVQEKRAMQQQTERELEQHVYELNQAYIKTHEQPGVRHYTGRDGIAAIYADQVAVGQPIHFINTLAGIDFYTYDTMHDLRMLAVKAGIERFALTPDTALLPADYKEKDKMYLLHRTWLQDDDYTAPVEWGVYGNKLYLISFGTEALGITIESAQIAESFRQLFALIDQRQRSQAWYSELPRLVQSPTT